MVHLYERESDLCGEAARSIAAALGAGELAIVIATEDHRRACATQLAMLGMDGEEAPRRGRILAFDAATLLATFVTDGRIDAAAFTEGVGSIVREQVETGHRVHVVGEMVSLLWSAGHVMAAVELEELWNELHATAPFSLLCAYGADSISGSRQAEALERLCAAHTSVLSGPTRRDEGGCMLPGADISARFPADVHAPRAARHLVSDAMRQWGYRAQLVDDAALVVTELAANAVVHAKSAFSLSLRTESHGIRLSVRDSLPIDRERLVVRSGRGIGLVACLSQNWGMHASDVGKVIWAELA